MAVFVNREGNISLFRVGAALAIFGILVIVGGFLLFQVEQQGYKSPLNIELYPGSQELGISSQNRTTRTVIYTIPDAESEAVADYYDEKLVEHDGTNANSLNRERCLRFPSAEGEIFEDFVEGAGVVPYYYRCLFNDTGLNVTRWTTVTIHPGVLNSETGMDTRGTTVVTYEQRWEP
ncbi:MAG: hypothetical protein RLP44_13740 [Aggregatilineales bacterium]